MLFRSGEFKYRAEAIRSTRKDKKAVLVEAIDPRSQGLLQALKALRLKLATKRRVPAYVIFSDRSLIDMAQKVPLTKWDFAEVHGVGDAKLEQFGEIFLAEIADYQRSSV